MLAVLACFLGEEEDIWFLYASLAQKMETKRAVHSCLLERSHRLGPPRQLFWAVLSSSLPAWPNLERHHHEIQARLSAVKVRRVSEATKVSKPSTALRPFGTTPSAFTPRRKYRFRVSGIIFSSTTSPQRRLTSSFSAFNLCPSRPLGRCNLPSR